MKSGDPFRDHFALGGVGICPSFSIEVKTSGGNAFDFALHGRP
jgi:hypothetical protein